MSTNLEHIHVDFHNRANDLFFSLFRQFQAAIEKINRKKEEYFFQQTREQYINTLQQQLELIAKNILQNNQQHKEINQLDQNLQHFIKEYLHRFVQKITEL